MLVDLLWKTKLLTWYLSKYRASVPTVTHRRSQPWSFTIQPFTAPYRELCREQSGEPKLPHPRESCSTPRKISYSDPKWNNNYKGRSVKEPPLLFLPISSAIIYSIFFNVINTLAIKHQWNRCTRKVHYTEPAHAFRLWCPGDAGIMFFVWHIVRYYGHLQGLEQNNELHCIHWFIIRCQSFSKVTNTHTRHFLPILCEACLKEEISLKYSVQSGRDIYLQIQKKRDKRVSPPAPHYM